MSGHKDVRIERKRCGRHWLIWRQQESSWDKSEMWSLDTLRGFVKDKQFMRQIEEMPIGSEVKVDLTIESRLKLTEKLEVIGSNNPLALVKKKVLGAV